MLKLWNTATKKLEEIKPIAPGKIGFYACGPTVYQRAHIGNLRAYVMEYLLRKTNEARVGFIAQDVQEVIPEAIEEDENGYLIVDNDPILWTMFNAIKELKTQNDELRSRVEALEGR